MTTGIGQARLAIPQVNQNPKPPHLAGGKVVGHDHFGLGKSATATKTTATTPAQPTNAAPTTQTSPTDPFKLQAEGQQDGIFKLPSYTAQPGQPDPRDSTYWQNVSKLMFTAEQSYSKGLAEQTTADTSYASALRGAIEARKGQARSLGEEAIRGNLGASGWLNRTEASQVSDYTNERAGALGEKTLGDQEREAARKAILQGYGIDTGGELGDAAHRYAEGVANAAQTEEPELGGGVGPNGEALYGVEPGNQKKNGSPQGTTLRPKQKPPASHLGPAHNAAKVAIGGAMVVKKKGKKK